MVLTLCTLPDGVLHLYQASWKYLNGLESYWADMISILKFTKGHDSVKLYVEFQYLFSAHRVMVLFICIKFHEQLKSFQSYWTDTICDGRTDRRTDGQADKQLWEKQYVSPV